MKKIKFLIVGLVAAILLSIGALSQLSPTVQTVTKTSQITPTISLEEKDTCTTSFYDEIQSVYSNCIYYFNSTHCLNSSGPNTGCSIIQSEFNYPCKTGEAVVSKNKTECQASKFIVSLDKDTITEKKEIDFSNWGVCINTTENGCLAITCGTLKGGSARNGIFNGCDGGKSCQKFLFCQDTVKVLYKASRSSFVEYDPTYHLPELAVKEVGQ